MKKNAESVFRELKDDILTYVELKLELLKLNTYERGGKVIAVFSYGLLLSVLVIITSLFALLALGFLLSTWLNSMSAGFGIVAAIYLLQIGVVILNKRWICRKVIDVIISALNSNDEQEVKDATANTETERNDQTGQTVDAD